MCSAAAFQYIARGWKHVHVGPHETHGTTNFTIQKTEMMSIEGVARTVICCHLDLDRNRIDTRFASIHLKTLNQAVTKRLERRFKFIKAASVPLGAVGPRNGIATLESNVQHIVSIVSSAAIDRAAVASLPKR